MQKQSAKLSKGALTASLKEGPEATASFTPHNILPWLYV